MPSQPHSRTVLRKPLAQKIRKNVTPSSRVHKRYLSEAIGYVEEITLAADLTPDFGRKLPFSSLEIMESHLFPMRQYLVARAAETWMKHSAPNCNAFAVPEFQIGPFRSPPMVFIPEGIKINRHWRAVLEHEFVHVNQALLKRFPGPEDFQVNAFSALLAHTWAEYEANYLELSLYPEQMHLPAKRGLTLESWCTFRGYTQALEQALAAIGLGKVSPRKVDTFLWDIQSELPSSFRKLGLAPAIAQGLVASLPAHLNFAMAAIENRGLPKGNMRAWKRLKNWVKDDNLPKIKKGG